MSEPQYPTNPEASAFPWNECTEDGLSKREYFAAKAMQGMLATERGWDESAERLAALAIAQADALIAELNRTGK